MKVGDLVKFNDVSSFSEWGRGHFQKLTGTLGIVVGFATSAQGTPLTTVLMNGEVRSFHPSYFKEIANDPVDW